MHPAGGATAFGWYNGPSSRCIAAQYKLQARAGNRIYTFPGGSAGSSDLTSFTDATCFPMSCDASGALFVHVRDQPLRCESGAMLDLSTALPSVYLNGVLGPCPDNGAACATFACPNCTAGGDCIRGQCVCKLGFTGPGCDISLITGVDAALGCETEVPDEPFDSGLESPSLAMPQLIIIVVSTAAGVILVLAVILVVITLLRPRSKGPPHPAFSAPEPPRPPTPGIKTPVPRSPRSPRLVRKPPSSMSPLRSPVIRSTLAC